MAAESNIMDNLDTNTLFIVQCVIAGVIGGLEFCFPALFVDTFNTFEVYTSHRLYGATMIVNAIIVYTMRETKDHKIKREMVQAFLFQFGLHIIVLLRPQVWGFLTPFNKVNLLCSFGLAAAFGYLLMGEKRKVTSGINARERAAKAEKESETKSSEIAKLRRELKNANDRIKKFESESKSKR
jgi:hypothetical protein